MTDNTDRHKAVLQGLEQMQRLLTQHTTTEGRLHKRDDDRRKAVIKILGIVAGLVALAGGGTITYQQMTPQPAPPIEAADVQETVEKRSSELEQQVGENTEQVHRLKEIATDQQIELEATQVQLVEGIDYIGQKIDKAHPGRAGGVPEPASLKAAKERTRRAEVQERIHGDGG